MTKPNKWVDLSRSLGYAFESSMLLRQALTHRSVPQHNNERLEFLGDSLINFFAAQWVYQLFPHATEGELSRFRTRLVRGETLAEVAREINLGPYLQLGMGEMRTGGADRTSILADALEAVIAAIFLDGGLETCQQTVARWFESRLHSLQHEKPEKDPKTQLQEYLQSKALGLPTYEVIDIRGKDHEQVFTVACYLMDSPYRTQAEGSSRRRAEQSAALALLAQLQKENLL